MSKIIVLLLFILFIPATQAQYSFEGIPFEIATQGTVKGGLYIQGGHGLEFPPYPQKFDVPDGSIRWARLYVGVWGGTEKYEGWVQADLNGRSLDRVALLGMNDNSTNVYCSGNGVYWMSYEVTDIITKGENAVTVKTSRGEPGNKLDGRVYGTVLAAVYEERNAPEITYRIYEGNVNLHGRGWSGKFGKENNEVSVYFNDTQDSNKLGSANLTVVYLTSSKGLPDYLLFNGHEIGAAPQYLLDKGYSAEVRDIANEVSGEASSGAGGELTRYFDIDSFEVLQHAREDNILTFLRGRDQDGDGEIGETEGEDYLHPVIASLVLSQRTALDPKPDLSIDIKMDEDSLIDGRNVEIPVVIGNTGGLYKGGFKARLKVDGSNISSISAGMDGSGVNRSTINWHAVAGDHLLEVIVEPEVEESNKDNNIRPFKVHVKTMPDLSVTINEPKKIETQGAVEASSLLLMLLVVGGSRRKKAFVMAVFLVAAGLSGCISTITESKQMDYLVPIVITNNGEANAQHFDVNLYLDGNRTAAMEILDVAGSYSIKEELRIKVAEGSHTLRATVNEKKNVIESDGANNVNERVYNFT
jgi:subtilase family serine protease